MQVVENRGIEFDLAALGWKEWSIVFRSVFDVGFTREGIPRPGSSIPIG